MPTKKTNYVILRNCFSLILGIIAILELNNGNIRGAVILIVVSIFISSFADNFISKRLQSIYSPLRRSLISLPLILLVAITKPPKGLKQDTTTKTAISDTLATSSASNQTKNNVEPDDIVRNDYLNASVWQVKYYLKRNLNDADSYEPLEWSEVQKIDYSTKNKYLVRHKYRAKNQFGAVIISNQIFYLDSLGTVVNIKDWK